MLGAVVVAGAIALPGCAKLRGKVTSDSVAAVYQNDCARCHGAAGEGVPGEFDQALQGDRTLPELARYVGKWMPDDDPGRYSRGEAALLADYVFHAFYSPEARARIAPPRVQLARLTAEQFRQSAADLVGSFRAPGPAIGPERGLAGEYFKNWREKDKGREEKVITRTDAAIDFDFGAGSPGPGIEPDHFTIRWRGSLLVGETGWYEFRLRTRNGARLYLNTSHEGDGKEIGTGLMMDGWVASGLDERALQGRLFLLGGRAYPLRFDFFKYKEKSASVHLDWKPPHQSWSLVPREHLAPVRSLPTAVVAAPFPPDDSSQGYARGTSVAKEWDRAVTDGAVETAQHVLARLDALAGTQPEAPDRAARLRAFCGQFAERAFRRPLTEAQRKAYVEGPFLAATNPVTAVKQVVLLVMKSPRFLYPELGPAVPDDYSVAGRLALALWDSLPDQALRADAAAGALHGEAEVAAQVRRMLGDARTRAKLDGFFRHWLAMDLAEEITKDPALFPGFTESLVSDARHSLELFVEDVVWGEAADFRQLLRADHLFLNPPLAAFYGAPPPAGPGFEKIRFDPRQRAGIFTHPYLLAAFSYHRTTSPIRRGVFLTRHVMGRTLRPPPMAMTFQDETFDPTLTMREKVTQLTRKEACMGCHAIINPLGFSLENFDAAGRFRTVDNLKPVDPAVAYRTGAGEVLDLAGPRDLAEFAVGSREAQVGFVRQLFHHAVKQPPAAYGPDTLDQLHAEFAKSGYHIRGLLADIARKAARHGVAAGRAPELARGEGTP
jgi:hypothetical protein